MVRSFAGIFRWPRRKTKNRHTSKRNIRDTDVSVEAVSGSTALKTTRPPKKARQFFSKRKTDQQRPQNAAEPDFSLVCYLCGQHVQKTNLPSHVEDCIASWRLREETKPEDERVPLPKKPELLNQPLPVDASHVEAFNSAMRSAWLRSINHRCEHCKKTLGAEAYYRHLKTCHARTEPGDNRLAYRDDELYPKLLGNDVDGPSTLGTHESDKELSDRGLQEDMMLSDGFVRARRASKISGRSEISGRTRQWISTPETRPGSSMRSIFSGTSARRPRDFAVDESSSGNRTPPMSPGSLYVRNLSRRSGLGNLPKPIKKIKANQARRDALKRSQSARSAFGRTLPAVRYELASNPRPSSAQCSATSFPPRIFRGYTCYLCGRQFAGGSLALHLPRCEEQWKSREALKKRKEDRLPLPSPPPELYSPLPTEPKAIEAFNDVMLAISQRRALLPCRQCDRRFTPEALSKHLQVCTGLIEPGPSRVSHDREVSPENPNLLTTTSTEILDSDPGPVHYFCYLCGRQYGSRSLFLHIPRCQKLWKDREATKPKQQRRRLPPPPPELEGFPNVVLPTDPREVFKFNNSVYSYWDRVSLYTCQKCHRSFNEESYAKHQRLCVGESTAVTKIPSSNKPPTKRDRRTNRTVSKPADCHRKHGLPIHYVCYLCGGEFSSKNLLRHVHKCEKQWLENEASRPESERKALPTRPDELLVESLPSHLLEVAQFNSTMLQHWEKHALTVCETCGRLVKAEAIERHAQNCVAPHA